MRGLAGGLWWEQPVFTRRETSLLNHNTTMPTPFFPAFLIMIVAIAHDVGHHGSSFDTVHMQA